MNRIIYLTIAQKRQDFKNNLPFWKTAPNTSNQNFHNKLIRSLSLTHKVEVISVRPINKNFKKKSLPFSKSVEGNITWNYVKVKSNRIYKLFHNKRNIINTIKANSSDTIFVDTLNLTLLNCALKLRNKSHAKIIGICTDSPNNISFISDSYKNRLLKLGRTLDGYVCLTNKINSLYNTNKPFVIIDGINELTEFNSPIQEGKYIYFGGSLMREYGVYELIKAFNELNYSEIKLVICGHHEQDDFKDYIKNNDNIIYLGVRSYEEVANLEHYSLMAVNPRPINPLIDEYSIPSKTLEFMTNDALTVCVDNPLLNPYKNCIIWAKSGAVQDLKEAMIKAINLGDNKSNIINKAKKEVLNRTSFESINQKLSRLL